MSRRTPEWIAKHDDEAIPPRVKVRVFEAHGGICHLSQRKIMAGDQWDCDHIIALCNGGQHRETNLAPALRDKHREKTAEDVAAKSKSAKVRAHHLGVKTGRPFPGSKRDKYQRRMDGSVVRRDG
jgi:5-methylcytosine-specific restriction protein A